MNTALETKPLHGRLSDAQRTDLLTQFHRDGYIVLPELLPAGLVGRCIEGIDRIAFSKRGNETQKSVKVSNVVDADAVFLELMMYPPALQLAYDCFGPMFQLCQSNIVSRPASVGTTNDFVSASPWHADGPRPNLFPSVPSPDGAMGLHYLKFGYFFTDLTHKDGGALQIVRGSHLRRELDGKKNFDVNDYGRDLVTFNCPAGTVVAFHQAQWHAAAPNRSTIERKNAYISYCPTWMKPLDREYPTAAQLEGRSPTERFLLGEPRPALRWWLPSAEDLTQLAAYRRDGQTGPIQNVNYD